jgi:hypothetical protein
MAPRLAAKVTLVRWASDFDERFQPMPMREVVDLREMVSQRLGENGQLKGLRKLRSPSIQHRGPSDATTESLQSLADQEQCVS